MAQRYWGWGLLAIVGFLLAVAWPPIILVGIGVWACWLIWGKSDQERALDWIEKHNSK